MKKFSYLRPTRSDGKIRCYVIQREFDKHNTRRAKFNTDGS